MKPSLVIALCVFGGFSSGAEAQPSMERIHSLSRNYVQRYADIYGVPANLAEAIIQAESNWRPDAVSPKGAAGLMQLMPATARRFGVRNIFNLKENIKAGISYLSWLMKTFNGDLRLVTAAYFVGEGRILKRRLDYASPEAFRYVTLVAKIYRAKQLDRRIRINGSHPRSF
jgi:soluble lytic murein transglycosylase-like protein